MDSFYKYYDSQSTAKRGFDKMQQSFECCGVYGPSDWKNISESIPSSCCRFSDQQCYELPGNLYEKVAITKSSRVFALHTLFLSICFC